MQFTTPYVSLQCCLILAIFPEIESRKFTFYTVIHYDVMGSKCAGSWKHKKLQTYVRTCSCVFIQAHVLLYFSHFNSAYFYLASFPSSHDSMMQNRTGEPGLFCDVITYMKTWTQCHMNGHDIQRLASCTFV